MTALTPALFAPPAAAKILNKAYADSFTHLYRHFDADSRLLYVGISLSVLHRLLKHRERSHWYHSISTIKIETFATRDEALQAERLAIENEAPLFNVRMASPGDEEAAPSSSFELSRSQILAQIVTLDPVYTVLEAAALLKVPSNTLQRLVKEKKIASIRVGRATIITGWQILEFIEYASVSGSVE